MVGGSARNEIASSGWLFEAVGAEVPVFATNVFLVRNDAELIDTRRNLRITQAAILASMNAL